MLRPYTSSAWGVTPRFSGERPSRGFSRELRGRRPVRSYVEGTIFHTLLARGEQRHPLLVEGRDPLPRILALEQLLLQLALERLPRRERQLRAGLHGALDEPHRPGRLVRRAELPGV